jgi:hypothetical protein
VILDGFNPEERQTQHYSQYQANDLIALLTNLGTVNGQRHRKAAQDQDNCIDRSQSQIEVVAGGGKVGRKLRSIERVGKKHPAKEHEFGDEKNPHAESASLALLLHVLEVVLERRVACLMLN